MNMRWTVITGTAEPTLAGVKIKRDIVGGKIVAVEFTDADGGRLRIDKNYDNLVVSHPAPKMVQKWFVAGYIKSLKIAEYFDTEDEARTFALKQVADFDLSTSTLTVKPVSVPNVEVK